MGFAWRLRFQRNARSVLMKYPPHTKFHALYFPFALLYYSAEFNSILYDVFCATRDHFVYG